MKEKVYTKLEELLCFLQTELSELDSIQSEEEEEFEHVTPLPPKPQPRLTQQESLKLDEFIASYRDNLCFDSQRLGSLSGFNRIDSFNNENGTYSLEEIDEIFIKEQKERKISKFGGEQGEERKSHHPIPTDVSGTGLRCSKGSQKPYESSEFTFIGMGTPLAPKRDIPLESEPKGCNCNLI